MVRVCALLSFLIVLVSSITAQTSTPYIQRYDEAVHLQRSGQNAEALLTFQQAIELAEGDSLQIARCLNSMASLADKLGAWADAVEYGHRAIGVFERENRDTMTAYARYSTGRVFYHIGDYENAIGQLLAALEIFKTKQLYVEQSATHNMLGLIYNEQSDYSMAIQHHKTALHIREALDASDGMTLVGQSLNNLGVTYRDMEYLDSAQFYFLASLEVTTALNDSVSITSDYYNLARVEMMSGNYQKAQLYMDECLKLLTLGEDLRNTAFALDLYGQIQTQLGAHEEALHYLNRALAMARRGSWKDLILDNYLHQAELAKKQGNPERATDFYDRYIDLNRAMVSLEKLEAQKRLEVQYDVRSKEQENAYLKQENEIKQLEVDAREAENALFRRGLIAAVLALALLLLFVLLLMQKSRERKKQAEQEREHKREMHHRLKNNLQALSGLCSMEIGRHTDGATTKAITRLKGQVQSMILVHNHLTVAPKNLRTHVEMKPYLEVLIQTVALAYGFDEHSARLRIEAETLHMRPETAQSLGLIVNEAVSNSFKHGHMGSDKTMPEVHVSLLRDSDERICLKVSDNGPGLPANFDLDQLRSTGMRLIYSLARELDAILDMDSNNGLTLTLRFKQKERD